MDDSRKSQNEARRWAVQVGMRWVGGLLERRSSARLERPCPGQAGREERDCR